jgi:hypothetical protein
MIVYATHEISNPELFWSGQLDLPAGTEFRAAIPSADGRNGVCIFKSDSVETVRAVVDGATSAVSKNEFYAVNEENVQGLAL